MMRRIGLTEGAGGERVAGRAVRRDEKKSVADRRRNSRCSGRADRAEGV
jgi:hypothetical protein